MWIEEGFTQESFWRQTGRSYQIAMEARHAVRKYEIRRDTVLAWQIGNFTGAAFGGKLRDLADYLPAEEGRQGQASGAMLFSFLMKMKRKGVPMSVERIDRLSETKAV